MNIDVIGGGLAGCEAAWQIARRGLKVRLIEMKPARFSPAHSDKNLCELVCSNSLKGNGLDNACGLLKEEMRRMGSLVIACADRTRVPAGGALAVDREAFAALVTEKIKAEPNIEVVCALADDIPEGGITVVATGPLTEGPLNDRIAALTGEQGLHFFDAAAPVVTAASIDAEKTYFAARYGKGTPDYINCPMNKEEYRSFWEALVGAERAPLHGGVEKPNVFEGCMPVEIMASRGEETLRFGPLKPKGLPDPKTGREPWAVLQLRRDNAAGTLYNLVGFQTNLRFGEQKRVFSMIPGLENAEFVRYGVMHRNTYINSPRVLSPDYSLKARPAVFFAGQLTGVEGYVESASSGLLAGINAARRFLGEQTLVLPPTTMSGALAAYITDASHENFQPMNANFGIIEWEHSKIKNKKERYEHISANALANLASCTKIGSKIAQHDE